VLHEESSGPVRVRASARQPALYASEWGDRDRILGSFGRDGQEFFDARDLVQVKYEMVRRVEAESSSVTAAASSFGMSRQSYYTAAAALSRSGLVGLLPAKPGPRRAHKLTDEVLDHLEARRADDPGLRASEMATEVDRRFGIQVHPRSVERALARREADRSPKSD
jgi:transposase